jgi:predicted lipid-binding transport protein (Tim44 family)
VQKSPLLSSNYKQRALYHAVRWNSSIPTPSAQSPQDEESTAVSPTPPNQQREVTPDEDDPGAIGGFMRGLIGGRDVAAEDAFVAEAKEQGIDLPPPPPPHRRADLVPVKRRKRREDSDESEESIRDRLFSRFGGSAFMKNAFEAKDRIADRIDESDNPLVNVFRNLYDRFFAENEMAMVVREIREDDPSFTVSQFLHDAETAIIPEILGAYLAGDRSKLEGLCTEDAARMLRASMREREAEGLVIDSSILAINDVELSAGRLLEDAPVLIVTFSAQQINCIRSISGDIIEGAIDDIRSVYYVWAFVRETYLEENVPTGGGMADDAKGSAKGEDEFDANSGDTRGSDANHDHAASERKGIPAEGQNQPLPWKMMEMVIRGAHSTI